MHTIAFIVAIMLALATLLDAFETILLPRRINHRFRYSKVYYRTFWRLWRGVATGVFRGKWREAMLGMFGPLSLLGLFASWVASLIFAFAIAQWSVGSLAFNGEPASSLRTFHNYLYYSGTTYFTLGMGDIVPSRGYSRGLTVAESGLGFGFLAIIISYLPVLYQAFSRREVTISLLDARAGSPPTGGEFVLRILRDKRIEIARASVAQWEQWCGELLESHISFPVLAFYRSQHGNQSWLAALTAMLDACALILAVFPESEVHQAKLTFAMARHAAVDITLVFGIKPPATERRARAGELPAAEVLERLGKGADALPAIQSKFAELRALYEPFLLALSAHFVLALPPVMVVDRVDDNWQRSSWMARTPGIGNLAAGASGQDHFA